MRVARQTRSVHLFHIVLVTSVSLLAAKEVLAVVVKTQGSDHNVGGVDGDLGLLTVGLFSVNLLNVDAVSTAVDLSDLAFLVFVAATNNLHSVSVANRDRPTLVLCGQLLAQSG